MGGVGGAASRHTTAAWEKWKKSSADLEGGQGGGSGPPWKIISYMEFYRR